MSYSMPVVVYMSHSAHLQCRSHKVSATGCLDGSLASLLVGSKSATTNMQSTIEHGLLKSLESEQSFDLSCCLKGLSANYPVKETLQESNASLRVTMNTLIADKLGSWLVSQRGMSFASTSSLGDQAGS